MITFTVAINPAITFTTANGGSVNLSVSYVGAVSFTINSATHNVPSGGTDGQVLAKISNDDYDVDWVDPSGGGGTIDASSIADGSVSNTKFQYLNNATSDIQSQLNGKATEGTSVAFTSVNINGVNGNGHIHYKHQSSDPSSTANSTIVYAGVDGELYQKNDGNAKTKLLTASQIGTDVQAYSSVLANTTASFTTAEEDKLSSIAITQPVDLDTLETNSHNHSNKSILDATTSSFTTTDKDKLDLLAVTQVEVDFGSTPVGFGTFTISDASVTATTKIIASLDYSAPTDKDLDEIEMDDLIIRAGNCGTGTFDLFITEAEGSYLHDKFKINYIKT